MHMFAPMLLYAYRENNDLFLIHHPKNFQSCKAYYSPSCFNLASFAWFQKNSRKITLFHFPFQISKETLTNMQWNMVKQSSFNFLVFKEHPLSGPTSVGNSCLVKHRVLQIPVLHSQRNPTRALNHFHHSKFLFWIPRVILINHFSR